MHLCLTVERVASGLHLSVFLIRFHPHLPPGMAGVGKPPHGLGVCIWIHLVNGTGNSPSPGRPTPGVVKQDKSSGGSVDTTKTCSDPQKVRMSSGERPIGAARGKKSDTEALCQPPPPFGMAVPAGKTAKVARGTPTRKHSGHRRGEPEPQPEQTRQQVNEGGPYALPARGV